MSTDDSYEPVEYHLSEWAQEITVDGRDLLLVACPAVRYEPATVDGKLVRKPTFWFEDVCLYAAVGDTYADDQLPGPERDQLVEQHAPMFVELAEQAVEALRERADDYAERSQW